MEIAKKTLRRIWWLGRATATVMGLAVILALTVGLATAALGAVPGDPFKLGRLNAVNAATSLVGRSEGAILRLDNNSSAANAQALALEAQPGKAPLTVNGSAGKATNLEADRLDGKDATAFFSGKTYVVQDGRTGPGGGQLAFRSVACDQGDALLSGSGGGSAFDGDDLRVSSGGSVSRYSVFVQDNNNPSGIVAEGLCADFPPLRP